MTLDIALENPNEKWDFDVLSQHPNITWKMITDHPNLEWDFRKVINNPNLTMDIILNELPTFAEKCHIIAKKRKKYYISYFKYEIDLSYNQVYNEFTFNSIVYKKSINKISFNTQFILKQLSNYINLYNC